MIYKMVFSFFLMLNFPGSKIPEGEKILKEMHDRYAGKWYSCYTFYQTTEIYRNDSLKKTDIWYEAVQFPDHFRIDFGPADSSNALIFKGDSAYNFKNGILRSVRKDDDDLTFLLGGMYFYPFDVARKKIKELGYDINKAEEETWKGKQIYVIGAKKGEQANQVWIDKEKLIIVRMIKYDHKGKLEGIFTDHIKLGNGWTETKAIFYYDNKLIQVEKYHNCRTDLKIDPRLFEPSQFLKSNWHK
ncbi:MAG TPA: hypothetical protein VGO09_05960 [Flavisolibacter sp.]|nr:hypothetical protein [Flavisolibacter sp.]